MNSTRILVVDDEESIRKLLKSRLEREGQTVDVASNVDEACAFYEKNTYGVIVTDLRMPGKDGFQLMDWVAQKNTKTKMIVITGHGEKNVAVQALRHGAADYLEKPFDLDELTHAVKRCQREFQLQRENDDLLARLEARVERAENRTVEATTWYNSQDNAMKPVNEWLTVLRRESMRGTAEEPSVLILGESGTGKEGVARQIHQSSRRGKGPWVAVNCANFSEQLLESELFGHEKGAFTGANTLKRGLFEIAKGGTLFLDEVGEMDPKLQAKLLRVLQEKAFRRVGGTADLESDVRVVAATNVNLDEKVASGQFREDLYHRMNRVVIQVPALRNRTNDLVPMAKQFAERAYRNRGKVFGGFTPDAEEGIRNYNWPGNVRELLNVVERTALVDTTGAPVSFRNLAIPGNVLKANGAPKLSVVDQNATAAPSFSFSLGAGSSIEGGLIQLKKQWSDAFEREYLSTILKKYEGNVSAAAREAQMDRSNFLRMLRRHSLRSESFRKVGSTNTDTGTDSGSGESQAA